ncbi:hypothetical protein ACFPTR_05820 [Aliibacillus thermotolerans]|uniref:Uncharacterized protein n=1 Tax=Aliibacillus thermotolerans TaxID=1834418 RepID=A0ABW0U6M9_9BACI|nr:hypothetical protein [Aliibacillus thermotolerans]MDA3130902.1 hypothetical protein [Aliibacillus thermotolerans]
MIRNIFLLHATNDALKKNMNRSMNVSYDASFCQTPVEWLHGSYWK